jgi:hypothetical protein
MEPYAPKSLPAPERADNPKIVSARKPETLNHDEFVRTQSQLMQTMLKAMILASGWKDDGHQAEGPSGSDSNRSAA